MNIEITKGQFQQYEKVRRSGKYNMIMDADQAIKATGLPQKVYWKIIDDYTELSEQFVRDGGEDG